MYPMLKNRECVCQILPLTAELKPGDVALYQASGGKYILHRVRKINGSTVIFQGDHNYWKETVDLSRVVGIAVRFMRNGQWVTMEDPAYLRYVRLLPLRRAGVWVRSVPHRIKTRLIPKQKKSRE